MKKWLALILAACLMLPAVSLAEEAGPQTEFYVPSSFLKKENILAIILEGPKAALVEPGLGTFYEVKDVDIQITMG